MIIAFMDLVFQSSSGLVYFLEVINIPKFRVAVVGMWFQAFVEETGR